MGKIYLIKGNQRRVTTDFIINKIEALHADERSSEYLFLGSSGGFLNEFREKVLERTEAIFNNHYKVINQYVVEEMKKIYKGKIHVDKSVLSALVLDVIEDDNAVNEMLKGGNGIVELFMTYYSVFNEYSSEHLLAESQWVEDDLIKIFAGIYAKFETLLQSNNMYSTYDAYRMFAEAIQNGDYVNKYQKKILFVDGFDDLSNLVRNFLAVFMNCFEETYITIPVDRFRNVMDYSFDEFITLCRSRNVMTSDTVKEIFVAGESAKPIEVMCDCFESGEIRNSEDSPLPIQVAEVQNPYEQIMLTASLVKQLVVQNKEELANIAVITRDINKAGALLADAFEKFGIPYRFEGDLSILDSINVNRLILPFRVFYSGFDPELLLSYVESGFVDLEGMTFADFERVFKSSGLGYVSRLKNKNFYFSSFKNRKNEWILKIKKYKTFLSERRQTLSSIIDEQFDELSELEAEFDLAERAEKIIRNMFHSLSEMFGSLKKIPVESYDAYFIKQLKLLDERQMISDSEFEQIALSGFFTDVLIELKRLFIVMKNEELIMVNPVEYWKYLNLILQNKTFHSSSFLENRCMIMDLEASRYRNKDIKIYIDVLDTKYPRSGINKIYEYFSVNGVSLQDSAIMREERNFLLSVRNTNKRIFLIYPIGDISGNQQIRSFYIDRFLGIDENKNMCDDYFIDVSKYGEYENFSVQNFLIDKLNRYDINSEIFGEICSKFSFNWEFIKSAVEQMEKNEDSAFMIQNLDSIKRLFGDTLSPSKFGVLRHCSKEFYFKYLMKIRFSQDETEGFDYTTEGQILHSVLHSVFLSLTERELLLENMEETDFQNFFETEVVQFISNEVKAKMFHPEKILFDAELFYFKKMILEFLIRYRSSKVLLSNPEPEKNEQLVFFPTEFEVGIEKKDMIRLFEDPEIYLIGKIDRIDKSKSGEQYIYDYKRSEGSARKENAFQLMLYAYAERMKGNPVSGMGFLPVKSKLKKVTGAFLTHDDEEDLYYLINRGKPDKEQVYTFDALKAEIIGRINKVFSGDLNPDEAINCFNCGLYDMGLCFLRKRGDSYQE
ncbi:MAG TPA: PD-(D/E)XK nuclease family protein [Thermotogota bacterium]|nr:PD-(D/E)XK nuclease family protein [Thermotogota bacterium]HPJ87688.1 PD-(D/E)XK nuclease family protein [Thermotogota bacterium]